MLDATVSVIDTDDEDLSSASLEQQLIAKSFLIEKKVRKNIIKNMLLN